VYKRGLTEEITTREKRIPKTNAPPLKKTKEKKKNQAVKNGSIVAIMVAGEAQAFGVRQRTKPGCKIGGHYE